MTTYSHDVVDCLSLLSLKVASNVFDLSSGLHHVSIRDQIVRAQLVVRDLKRGDPNLNSILIVGAGVAGISAALEAAKHDIKHITIVETKNAPFSLLKTVKSRFVGPFMYEWPSPFSMNQSYPVHNSTTWGSHSTAPLQWRAKKPTPACELATKLETYLLSQLQDIAAKGNSILTICVDVSSNRITRFVRNFAANESARALSRLQRHKPGSLLDFGLWNATTWPNRTKAEIVSTPNYVLLAAGMGRESVKLVAEDASGAKYTGLNFNGPLFWDNDSLKERDSVNRNIAVFGGGDGALQDVLRALTRFDHPLEFIEFPGRR